MAAMAAKQKAKVNRTKTVDNLPAARAAKAKKSEGAETTPSEKPKRDQGARSCVKVAKEYGVSVNGLREAASLTPEL